MVNRAVATVDLETWGRGEDVALGFWLQQLLAERVLPQVSFVRAYNNELHNLGCCERYALLLEAYVTHCGSHVRRLQRQVWLR